MKRSGTRSFRVARARQLEWVRAEGVEAAEGSTTTSSRFLGLTLLERPSCPRARPINPPCAHSPATITITSHTYTTTTTTHNQHKQRSLALTRTQPKTTTTTTTTKNFEMALLSRAGLSTAAPVRASRAASRTARVVRVRAESTPEGADATPAAPAAPAPAAPVAAAAPAPAAAPQPVFVPASGSSAAASVNLWEAMKISQDVRNNVPFKVNGRLAQLGIVAGVGCELVRHVSIAQQFAEHSTFILGLGAILAVASAVPVLRGASADEAFGPLTPRAERFNSEAALLGFAALLILEAAKGGALF